MKKILMGLLAIVLIAAQPLCAQESAMENQNTLNIFPIKDSVIFYETIDTTAKESKDELYIKAKAWAVKTFNMDNGAIEMDNKEAGVLIGKGGFDGYYRATEMKFTYKVTVKDNKFRLQIFDVLRHNIMGWVEWVDMSKKYFGKIDKPNPSHSAVKEFEKVDREIKKVVDSFIKAMQVDAAKNDL